MLVGTLVLSHSEKEAVRGKNSIENWVIKRLENDTGSFFRFSPKAEATEAKRAIL